MRALTCVLSFFAAFVLSVVYLGYVNLNPSFVEAALPPAVLCALAGHFSAFKDDRVAKNSYYLSWVILSFVLGGLFFGIAATVGA